MAVIGDAYVVIHAITSGVKKEVQEGFKGVEREGENVGKKVGHSFNKGFNSAGMGQNSPIANALSTMFNHSTKDAIKAADAFKVATQSGYFLGSALTAAAGAIGALANGFVSLVGVTLAAAPAMAVLTNAIFGLLQVAGALKIAFHGVGAAIQAGVKAGQTSRAQTVAITKAQVALMRAYEDLSAMMEEAQVKEQKGLKAVADSQRELNLEREKAAQQIKELKFDSEDAAISEQKAAIELDKARETLARVSDLPPNSRARKEAELAFASADLNYRRAIDKNNTLKSQEAKNAAMGTGSIQDQIDGQQSVKDAVYANQEAQRELGKTQRENEKNITRGTQDLAQQEADLKFLEEGGANADAYAIALSKLSESAQEFVKFMVGLKGVGKDLQEAIGKELFPRLETAITTLVTKLLPVLKPLLGETGKVIGDVAKHLADVLTRADNLERIKRIWETNDKALSIFGDTIGNLLDVFLLIADAARPLVLEFANWTKNITGAWKATLEADTKSGKLAKTLETAADVVRKLGKLFGETFGAIGNLVKANVGEGSGGYLLLDYLTKAMTGLKNLTEVDGTPLKEFFRQGAENATKVLDVLGFLVAQILKLGASKEFGAFADQIKAALPSVEKIIDAFKEGLPSFGNLIKQVAEFIATVTSGDTIKTFFDILGKGLGVLNDFLKTDIGQKIVNIGNVIIPVIAALALFGQGLGLFEKVVVGNIAKVEEFASKIPGLTGFITKLKQELGLLTSGFEMANIPFLVTVGVIALIVAAFVLMYAKSEILRKAVGDLVSGVLQALQDAFSKINDAIHMAMPQFNGIMDIFKVLGDYVGKYVVPLFKVILVNAISTFADIVSGVIKVVSGLWYIFTDPIKGVKLLLSGFLDFFKAFFINPITNLIKQVNIFSPLGDGFKAVINKMIGWWNSFKLELKIPSNAVTNFLGIGGKGFTIQAPYVAPFAKGGVVQPTPGGTLARIGEAGRAERVEPLDAQGLSVRDRAIIEQLSGGGRQINMTINASPGMDERELAAIVSRQLNYEMRRGAA